ncbi:hypothetical protein [Paraburkholderia sacchari]|uniref:hypothetical protein n=1 Tax=Paraburkholderia sacchari TaxID=159450 RepID=UPI001BCEB44A|nr:hypothetical protein [Paraburkholderia sacchari]
MSRDQLLDRARRLAVRILLRARPEPGPDGVRLYSLVLVAGEVRAELVAHVRRLARCGTGRRAKVALPPLCDMRQQGALTHQNSLSGAQYFLDVQTRRRLCGRA